MIMRKKKKKKISKKMKSRERIGGRGEGGGGGVLSEKLRGVASHSRNPLSHLRPKYAIFPTLFMT